MVEVTQEDRLALREYLVERARRSFAGSKEPHAELLLETLARHRIAARNTALKEAAKVVERELALTAVANSEASSKWIDGFEFAWERVKAAIRNLKGPSNVD